MKKLKECLGHTNIVFVGSKTSACRESGKKGVILFTAARPKGIIVFVDRTTAELKDYNEITGALAGNSGISILSVYELPVLPESAEPCSIKEIFDIPLRECSKIWELPRVIDDYAIDEFLKKRN